MLQWIYEKLEVVNERYAGQFAGKLACLEECFAAFGAWPVQEHLQDACWELEKQMRALRELQMEMVRQFHSEGLGEERLTGLTLPSVSIYEMEGIYHLRFDSLLPFKTKSQWNLVCEELEEVVAAYLRQRGLGTPVFRQAVVVFCHHYRDGVGRRLRDYDNLERKGVLDTIAAFFLPDDNPRCMRSFDLMVEDRVDFTEVLVMGWEAFQGYILRPELAFSMENNSHLKAV